METKTSSSNLPRDIFLYILNFGMLYTSVAACIELLFQYTEVHFPDPLTFSYRMTSDNIRTAASILLVAYPVFLVSSWFIRKIIREHPEAAEFKPRKWLTYLTLFAAGITMIVDLIVLFDKFWGGEITPRFIVKVIIVLLIGTALFAYFVWELRNARQPLPLRKILAWGTLVLILASIGAGFLIVGSPELQRQRRFDKIRIQDMDTLYWRIISYYQTNAALPKTLHDIETHNAGFVMLKDPETQKDYEYLLDSSLKFELCAVFSAASFEGAGIDVRMYVLNDPIRTWKYQAGRSCFVQEVNPDMLPRENIPKPLVPAPRI